MADKTNTEALLRTMRAKIGEQKEVVDAHTAARNNAMTDVERTDLEFASMKETLRLQTYEAHYMEALRVVAQMEIDAEEGQFDYDALQRAFHADRQASAEE